MQKIVTALFAVLVAAAPAAAQDYKPIDFNFGFGWAFPTSEFGSHFDAGWNGGLGVTYNFTPRLGIQAEYMYTRMDGPEKTLLLSATPIAAALTNGILESNHQMHVGTFDLIYKTQSQEHPIGGYALGGGGIYHRVVQLTTPSVGYTTFCDPYYYVCYPAAVSVDTIIGDRSSNDFGINIGGGVTFGREGKFYVESRLHYVWGKTITPTASQLPAAASTTTPDCSGGCSTNATYYPLTFGFRW
jgi:outer membrane protein with beta-barrel domain